jgi:hypothetical protein
MQGSNTVKVQSLKVAMEYKYSALRIDGFSSHSNDVVVSLGQGLTASGTKLLDGNLYNQYAVG